MKSLAILSLFASAAYAQSGSSTANPLIPSGISSGCSSFLNQLNSDSSLFSCSSALVKATSAFGAGSDTSNATSSSVTTALNNLCGVTSACSEDTLRSKLTGFYAACQPELTTSSNAAVILIYDVLYSLYPLTQAVCCKGDDGKYCVIELGNSTSTGTSSSGKDTSVDLQQIQKTLWTPISTGSVSRRAEEAFYPNATTFHDSNILFLLLQPTLAASSLCVSCTRSILSAYISFESAIPYAVGLANSPLMVGQTALYKAVQNTCGASFLSGSVQAAGGIAGGIVSNGALDVVVSFRTLGAALVTVVLGFYTSL